MALIPMLACIMASSYFVTRALDLRASGERGAGNHLLLALAFGVLALVSANNVD